MKAWTKEQLKAFLEAVEDERLSPLWHTIAVTGMRRGEALGLCWIDVDLEAGRLSIRRALVPINREVVVSEPKTAKGRRVIAIDPGTVEVLKARATLQFEEQSEWDAAWIETGLVFTADNGAALDPESVSRYWRQAVKKSMLPAIRLHDLCRTHATPALEANINPKVVSERLGHATVSITLDTYSHHSGDARGGGGADRRARVRGRVACRPSASYPKKAPYSSVSTTATSAATSVDGGSGS